jgi:hypothetical protein
VDVPANCCERAIASARLVGAFASPVTFADDVPVDVETGELLAESADDGALLVAPPCPRVLSVDFNAFDVFPFAPANAELSAA